jgi:hypothetical protein
VSKFLAVRPIRAVGAVLVSVVGAFSDVWALHGDAKAPGVLVVSACASSFEDGGSPISRMNAYDIVAAQNPELSAIRQNLFARDKLKGSAALERRQRFGHDWSTQSLEQALKHLFGTNVGSVKVRLELNYVRYFIPGHDLSIIENVLGGFYNIESFAKTRANRGSQVLVDWHGDDLRDVNLPVGIKLAQQSFLSGNPSPVGAIDSKTVQTFRQMMDPSYRPNWQTMTADQQNAILKATPFVNFNEDLDAILRWAKTSRDARFVPALRELLNQWGMMGRVHSNLPREKKTALVLLIIENILADPSIRLTPFLELILTNEYDIRDAAANAIRGKDLNERELSIIMDLAKNTHSRSMLREYARIAGESADPRWIPILEKMQKDADLDPRRE